MTREAQVVQAIACKLTRGYHETLNQDPELRWPCHDCGTCWADFKDAVGNQLSGGYMVGVGGVLSRTLWRWSA